MARFEVTRTITYVGYVDAVDEEDAITQVEEAERDGSEPLYPVANDLDARVVDKL